MKKLAIFDFDGTLFDSIHDVLICFNKTLEFYGFPTLTREELIPCLGGNIDEITSLVLGENSSPENVEKVKESYLELYNPSKKELTVPFENAYEVLKRLQDNNILLAVNSNRLTYSLEELVGKYFSNIDFIAIEGHSYGNPSKPDPYGANRIIEKANVDADEAVYIGDSITDIMTAQNAGIDCILVKWGYAKKEDLQNDYPSKVVDDIEELVEIIVQ